jgi:hypothetical protein
LEQPTIANANRAIANAELRVSFIIFSSSSSRLRIGGGVQYVGHIDYSGDLSLVNDGHQSSPAVADAQLAQVVARPVEAGVVRGLIVSA